MGSGYDGLLPRMHKRVLQILASWNSLTINSLACKVEVNKHLLSIAMNKVNMQSRLEKVAEEWIEH